MGRELHFAAQYDACQARLSSDLSVNLALDLENSRFDRIADNLLHPLEVQQSKISYLSKQLASPAEPRMVTTISREPQ